MTWLEWTQLLFVYCQFNFVYYNIYYGQQNGDRIIKVTSALNPIKLRHKSGFDCMLVLYM